MNTSTIAKALTKALLGTLFLFVLLLSLFLSPQITWAVLTFSLFKAALATSLGWLFFLILSDALVKSIASSAKHAKAKRFDGGMLYHFLKPDENEIIDKDKTQNSPQ